MIGGDKKEQNVGEDSNVQQGEVNTQRNIHDNSSEKNLIAGEESVIQKGKGNLTLNNSTINITLTSDNRSNIAETIKDGDKNSHLATILAAGGLNVDNFLECLKEEEKSWTEEDLQNSSSPDIHHAFMVALTSAARKNEKNMHASLAKIMTSRIKARETIVEMAMNEAIAAIGKISENEMKFLALIFLALHIDINQGTDSSFYNVFNKASSKIEDINITLSIIELLEAIGCIKIASLRTSKLREFMSQAYPFHFLRSATAEEIVSFGLGDLLPSPDEHGKTPTFAPDETGGLYTLNPITARYIIRKLEAHPITGKSHIISPEGRRKLEAYCDAKKMTENEIQTRLESNVYNFSMINKLFDKYKLTQICLTPVGTAIARSYVDKENFGLPIADIEIWLKN